MTTSSSIRPDRPRAPCSLYFRQETSPTAQCSLELGSVPELNSTSSTNELGELIEDVENDELNKDTDDDDDAVEDILYMRGASFTIHLDPQPENSTSNSTKRNDEASAPFDRVGLRATSQVGDRIH